MMKRKKGEVDEWQEEGDIETEREREMKYSLLVVVVDDDGDDVCVISQGLLYTMPRSFHFFIFPLLLEG